MKEKKFKNLDLEKVQGRYIHYGHVFSDLGQYGGGIMDDFYQEVYRVHEGILSECLDNSDRFKKVKDASIGYFGLIINLLENLTTKQLKKKMKKMVKYQEENWDELKRMVREKIWLNKHLWQAVRGLKNNGSIAATNFTGRFSQKANPTLSLIKN